MLFINTLENKLNEINKERALSFLNKLDNFSELLLKENQKQNLTAITQKNEIYIKHFLDSIQAQSLLKPSSSVLDVGSGAGFPAIPLAIIREDVQFLLIDSLKKRVDFLNEVAKELDLKNVRAIHLRIEDLNKEQKFDYCLSRAVASLNILSEYCLPFVKIGGSFIAYKSEKTDEELEKAKNALKILGGNLKKVHSYELELDGERLTRTLIEIEKIKDSPKKYPRTGNKPRKEEL